MCVEEPDDDTVVEIVVVCVERDVIVLLAVFDADVVAVLDLVVDCVDDALVDTVLVCVELPDVDCEVVGVVEGDEVSVLETDDEMVDVIDVVCVVKILQISLSRFKK